MKKKLVLLISIFIILIVVLSIYMYPYYKTNEVNSVISKEYVDENELIKSYGKGKDFQYLSESIGQYMTYLLLIGDKNEFKQQVDILSKNFLVQKEKQFFIKWQVAVDTTTNASVDDIRIIEALYEGGERFNDSTYTELADKLRQTLETAQSVNGMIVDFYDWELEQATPIVHLSYIISNGLERFQSVNMGSYLNVLEGALFNPFFYEIYDLDKLDYQAADKNNVNMIDQFLIAIQYREITGEVPYLFDQWVKSEFDSKKQLFGMYEKETLEPAVNYESSSVYALGLIYFIKTGDQQYADKFHDILLKQPPFHQSPDYENIHFFDYIYSRTADKLYNK